MDGSIDGESGDHDLQTILALYDSSDLLAKLEDAAKVLGEMIPSGLVEQEDVLDDALAVVCSDLTQILQLGIKDRTLSRLMGYVEDLIRQSAGKPVNLQPEVRQDSIVSSREKLFDLVVALLRSPHSRQRFLAVIDDSHSTLMDLYESFAPLRSQDDRLRILKALQLLPHVDAPYPTDFLHEALTNTRNSSPVLNDRNFEAFAPNALMESPVETPETPQASSARPLLTKSHTRSRSDVDHIPSVSRSASSLKPNGAAKHHRRLSTASSSTDSRSAESVSSFSSSYFSLPRKGQSLISYLKSQDTVTCADLERENLHFTICEAIIAAVQHVQYERRHGSSRVYEDTENLTSSEVQVLSKLGLGQEILLGDPQSTPEEIPSAASGSSSPTGRLSASPEPIEAGDWSLLDVEHPSNSAEAIAISLLKHFSESQLPKASDLDWIVSELDTPQILLSLPRGIPVDPDPTQTDGFRLRGTLEWAPMRPQIIYHIQTPVALNTALLQQKNRCAGCGGKKDSYRQSKMRYCDYTGKYFCVLCHEYKQAIIPARVLLRWDFSKHYVSNFAADFLAKIYRDPLFDVSHCSLDLYKRSRILEQTRFYRTQLVLATEYVRSCRAATSAMAEIQQLPTFVWEQIHTYSLDLFCSVRDGVFPAFIRPVAELSMQHVLTCEFCSAKGHICEICRSSTLLFPFQLTTVFQCPQCFSCFHLLCVKPKPCPKCTRLEARRSDLSHES